MDITTIPVCELLPHAPPMVLLDRVLSYDDSTLLAEVRIRPDSVLCQDDGVPAWVGIEYMAQAVAAHAGFKARLEGEPPRIGYLLGTRSYKSSVGHYPIGTTLTIHIQSLFVEMALGAFACRIDMPDTVATATINVYQPDDDATENIDSGRIS
ncbi:MAG: hotdog family protein [Gammaproteobacteria bacterium]|nr:hotdog family protein [Gammaproteobacteria bacterium]MDH3432553.1 hotdog family protein [Gammaproteobacteria bacterium]